MYELELKTHIIMSLQYNKIGMKNSICYSNKCIIQNIFLKNYILIKYVEQ